MLEGLESVLETKWPSEEFIQPKRGDNGSFEIILVSGHSDLDVDLNKATLGECIHTSKDKTEILCVR